MTKQPVASDILRPTIHYRREAFQSGLKRCGYEVGQPPKSNPEPEDVLVIWNRSPRVEPYVQTYLKAKARVIVVENGYIGRDSLGRELFSICLDHHSGAGRWTVGNQNRWSKLGIDLKPWRLDGDEIIIMPQRSIGERGVAMPRGWENDVELRLRRITKRPVRIRPHPGKDRTDPTSDLKNAWAVVVWGSGGGIKSIVHGIPVFHDLPQWIGAAAAKEGISNIEDPYLGDRAQMLHRLSWAQWTVDEVIKGEPFKWLLG